MTFSENLHFTAPIGLTHTALIISVALALTIVNTFAVYNFMTKKQRNTFENLLLSLSISDLFTGIAVSVIFIFTLTIGEHLEFSDQIFIFVGFGIFAFSMHSSMIHVFIITLDRFVAVTFPIFHRLNRQRKTAKCLIVITTWGVPVTTSVMQLYFPIARAKRVMAVAMIIECVIVLLLYLYIIKTSLNRSVPGSNQAKSISREKQIILIVSSIGIFLVFFISISPQLLCLINVKMCDPISAFVLLLVNGLLNPFVYSLTPLIKYCIQRNRPRRAEVYADMHDSNENAPPTMQRLVQSSVKLLEVKCSQ